MFIPEWDTAQQIPILRLANPCNLRIVKSPPAGANWIGHFLPRIAAACRGFIKTKIRGNISKSESLIPELAHLNVDSPFNPITHGGGVLRTPSYFVAFGDPLTVQKLNFRGILDSVWYGKFIWVFFDTFTNVRTCGRGQHPGRMSRVGGDHNGEKIFIALFHVSEHSEHFKSILKN